MVRMDWDRILSIKAESLTDDEIEDLFPMIIRCDINYVEDIHHLRALVKLSQEMLQHKDNQVESLLLECDELKIQASATTSDTKRRDERKSKLDGSVLPTMDVDDIERDNGDSKQTDFSMTDNYSDTTRRKKDDKIKTLVRELEALENENDTLKRKLEILKDEMEDATENMNGTTEELERLRSKNITYKDEINRIELENSALLIQIDEMRLEREERDKAIDEFSIAIDARVAEWKAILDEKDSEISRLRGDLSQALVQSVTSVRQQNESLIVQLNEEIRDRDRIIVDLETKLLEAAQEINRGANLIEKLKTDGKKFGKNGRRKDEHRRDLVKNFNEANERLLALEESLRQAEDDATSKSQRLCEALADLRKYEDRDRALAETIKQRKELQQQVQSQDAHIQDLINVINNLETLNSCREMQIMALREKLKIPEDAEISIEGIALKSQEEARIRDELIENNRVLAQQNLDMKSDIRILRYTLSKSNAARIEVINEDKTRVESKNRVRGTAEVDDETKENVAIVIEENEALRKGMHEILDSIHDHDGKSALEVHSGTLERLLEALDTRHIAGWYHPAMRLQERLSVVEGSNSELRSQLKHVRSELHRKDDLIEKYAKKGCNVHSSEEPIDREDAKLYALEIKKIERVYKEELENWQKEKKLLTDKNQQLEETVEKLTGQLEIIDGDLRVIESGEDESKRAFAMKTRESAELLVKAIQANRKCSTLENLLNEESAKNYRIQKDAIDCESSLRKVIADLDKRIKILDTEIAALQSNLSNSVSLVEYNELKEKFDRASMRLRASYEFQLANVNVTDENFEWSNDDNSQSDELSKCQDHLRQLTRVNSELQNQLVDLQNELEERTGPERSNVEPRREIDKEISILSIENENLSRTLEIYRQEADMQYTLNSLKTLELDSLRHQILDLHAASEDKETIARLGFELGKYKALEVEFGQRRIQLESQIEFLRQDSNSLNSKLNDARTQLEDCRKICSARSRSYREIIDFLRRQYAGFTSVTALQRFAATLKKLVEYRAEINEQTNRAIQMRESAKLDKELLSDRLEIVQRLKDILEEQIGTGNVDDMMHTFAENSQYTLNDIRLKRKVTQLEKELKNSNDKLTEYESTMVAMEFEMINIQRIFEDGNKNKCETGTLSSSQSGTEIKVSTDDEVERKTVSTQARVEYRSVQVQSDPYDSRETTAIGVELPYELPEIEIQSPNNDIESTASTYKLQLDQALALASERSALIIKHEAKIAEYEAKIHDENKKRVEMARDEKLSLDANPSSQEDAVLKSTITSLQKIINQKEETIVRYQNLLKNDRDEHSRAADRFHEEIKGLREEIYKLQEEAASSSSSETYEITAMAVKEQPASNNSAYRDIEAEEKIARLTERASTLEADLNIAKELSERWRRLAEERLGHVDHMRQRLEEQHKNELESYRLELNKWQSEADTLRQHLSENRMQLAKGNMTMSKELQERESKIQELTVAYRQLQSEFEMMETMTTLSQQPLVSRENCATKMQDMANFLGRDQAIHYQPEVDSLRRQIKSQTEKDKMYKEQIADLKQQLSRRYMAAKTEERKVSNREMQLERKLKTLEEELHKARIQLDREYRVQEAKRLKTAEELSLWEKQKKWQHIAEKLKKELKEKGEEYNKLSNSYEKMRALVSCMEREKWYLRSKLRSVSGCVTGSVNENHLQYKIVENLQNECQTLRERMKQLTDRSESKDTRDLLEKLQQQASRIAALETVKEGNTYVIDKLEKLETARANLEKANIRLESENFEYRMEMEKINIDTPRLREKVEHLEKYVELLKVEKSSESASSRSSDKDFASDKPNKRYIVELEKTVFILKRVVEKLQSENKRLESKTSNSASGRERASRTTSLESGNSLLERRQYEQARRRVVALEADLSLAQQRIVMLENAASKEEDDAEQVGVLRQQLVHKSALLDKVKQLLTRAAINEKSLRQRIQQMEMKQTLSTISECSFITGVNETQPTME